MKTTKKGQKIAIFWPWSAKICWSKKRLGYSLTLPQRGCISNLRKFGLSDLEKMRYEWTNRWDWNHRSLPKIPGTKKKHKSRRVGDSDSTRNSLVKLEFFSPLSWQINCLFSICSLNFYLDNLSGTRFLKKIVFLDFNQGILSFFSRVAIIFWSHYPGKNPG